MRSLKAHQLYKTLRRMEGSEQNWTQIYIKLSELLNGQYKNTQKSMMLPTLLFLLSYSVSFETSELIKIVGIPVSIPIAFSLFVASSWLFMLVTHVQTIAVLFQARAQVSDQLRRQGIDSSMIGFFHGADDSELTQPLAANYFFTTKVPASFAINATLLVGFLAVTLLFVPIWGFTLLQQYELIFSDIGLIEKTAAGIGLLLLVCSVIFLICSNIPIRYSKNVYHIRWGFLWPLGGRARHPQSNKWLDEAE